MKYSEELRLRLSGVKSDEINAMKEQERLELEEAAKRQEEEQKEKEKEEASNLEIAQNMIKDLEGKLEAKEDELTKLNKEFAELANKQTIKDEPVIKETASDVMSQLFNYTKEE